MRLRIKTHGYSEADLIRDIELYGSNKQSRARFVGARAILIAALVLLVLALAWLGADGSILLGLIVALTIGMLLEPRFWSESYGAYKRSWERGNSCELLLPVHIKAGRLVENHNDEAAVALLKSKWSGHPESRLLLVDAYRRIAGTRMQQELEKIATGDPKSTMTLRAIEALGQAGFRGQEACLSRLLNSKSRQVRLTAASSLEAIDTAAARTALRGSS